eukprot:UN04473
MGDILLHQSNDVCIYAYNCDLQILYFPCGFLAMLYMACIIFFVFCPLSFLCFFNLFFPLQFILYNFVPIYIYHLLFT